MKTNIDLKEIWNKQNLESPEVEILYDMVNRFKRSNLYTLVVANILLLIISLFIGFIWYNYQPQLITTKIGIILTFIAMIAFLVPYNMFYPLLFKNKADVNSKADIVADGAIDAVGQGSVVTVEQGIYYAKEQFIYVNKQTLY